MQIKAQTLYRFITSRAKIVVKAIELNLPNVKIQFINGRQMWVHSSSLTDF